MLGPPLMFVFVIMTNILLMSSLISLLSNSLDKVGFAKRPPPNNWLTFAQDTRACTRRIPFNVSVLRWPCGWAMQRRPTNSSANSYAVYVLEASTSNRLVFFLPPLVCIHSATAAVCRTVGSLRIKEV